MNSLLACTGLGLSLTAALAVAPQQVDSAHDAPSRPAFPPPVVAGGCTIVGASHTLHFTPGAATNNTFVTAADPDTRKFIVYVPSTYSAQGAPYPVVYMFHGTGQTAQISMNKNTWDKAAEMLGFIAVYPEALPYLLVDGTTKTKWQTENVEEAVVDPSELPMADDVVYVRELQNTLIANLNIDCDRIYASGFSNGGAFVKTKLHVDMADVFAATTSAGGIGSGGGVAADNWPVNQFDFRPHFEVVGNMDDKKLDNCVNAGDLTAGQNLPMSIVNILATPCMWDPLTLFAEGLALDSTQYTAVEQNGFTQFVWDTESHIGPGSREYRFRVLPNMIHEYPSGTNYPIDYVPIFYMWMSQYTR